MDNSIIEKYKNEMLEMSKRATLPMDVKSESDLGGLSVSVTALRRLYPVENAEVTVFTGDIKNRTEIDKKFTDQSGKTATFYLPTPKKSLSVNQNETDTPFALYNIYVKAENLVQQAHLNIPVFSGVNSMQNADLILPSALGESQTEPIIIDEQNKFLGGSADA